MHCERYRTFVCAVSTLSNRLSDVVLLRDVTDDESVDNCVEPAEIAV